jgi:2-dehydropantoate 2-reductase
MPKRILFIGAGAIGSYLGAFLTRSGHDVTLVDPWAEQVETIRQKGISVTGPHDPFEARPTAVHLNDAARLPRDFEIAFVAMKAYDTPWATQLALRHLSPEGVCRLVPELLARSHGGRGGGAGRSVGSSCPRSAWRSGSRARSSAAWSGAPARVHDVFRPGEHDGRITPRVNELAEMLSVIDGSRATDNLWGERWCKLSQNCMGNPVQAMTGLGNLEVASSEVGRAITIHLAAESARVGLAAGLRIPKFGGAEPRSGRGPTSGKRGRRWTGC